MDRPTTALSRIAVSADVGTSRPGLAWKQQHQQQQHIAGDPRNSPAHGPPPGLRPSTTHHRPSSQQGSFTPPSRGAPHDALPPPVLVQSSHGATAGMRAPATTSAAPNRSMTPQEAYDWLLAHPPNASSDQLVAAMRKAMASSLGPSLNGGFTPQTTEYRKHFSRSGRLGLSTSAGPTSPAANPRPGTALPRPSTAAGALDSRPSISSGGSRGKPQPRFNVPAPYKPGSILVPATALVPPTPATAAGGQGALGRCSSAPRAALHPSQPPTPLLSASASARHPGAQHQHDTLGHRPASSSRPSTAAVAGAAGVIHPFIPARPSTAMRPSTSNPITHSLLDWAPTAARASAAPPSQAASRAQTPLSHGGRPAAGSSRHSSWGSGSGSAAGSVAGWHGAGGEQGEHERRQQEREQRHEYRVSGPEEAGAATAEDVAAEAEAGAGADPAGSLLASENGRRQLQLQDGPDLHGEQAALSRHRALEGGLQTSSSVAALPAPSGAAAARGGSDEIGFTTAAAAAAEPAAASTAQPPQTPALSVCGFFDGLLHELDQRLGHGSQDTGNSRPPSHGYHHTLQAGGGALGSQPLTLTHHPPTPVHAACHAPSALAGSRPATGMQHTHTTAAPAATGSGDWGAGAPSTPAAAAATQGGSSSECPAGAGSGSSPAATAATGPATAGPGLATAFSVPASPAWSVMAQAGCRPPLGVLAAAEAAATAAAADTGAGGSARDPWAAATEGRAIMTAGSSRGSISVLPSRIALADDDDLDAQSIDIVNSRPGSRGWGGGGSAAGAGVLTPLLAAARVAASAAGVRAPAAAAKGAAAGALPPKPAHRIRAAAAAGMLPDAAGKAAVGRLGGRGADQRAGGDAGSAVAAAAASCSSSSRSVLLRQAAPMVLNLENPVECTPEVLEMEMERMSYDELLKFNAVLDARLAAPAH